MYHRLFLPLVTTSHPRDNFCLASKAMPILRLQKLHSKQIRIKMQCVTTLSLVLYLYMDMLLVLVMTTVQTFKKYINILEQYKILHRYNILISFLKVWTVVITKTKSMSISTYRTRLRVVTHCILIRIWFECHFCRRKIGMAFEAKQKFSLG